MTKSQLCVKQNRSLKHHINRYKRQQMNFEKLLGAQVFKNHNCNPLQSSSSLGREAAGSSPGRTNSQGL